MSQMARTLAAFLLAGALALAGGDAGLAQTAKPAPAKPAAAPAAKPAAAKPPVKAAAKAPARKAAPKKAAAKPKAPLAEVEVAPQIDPRTLWTPEAGPQSAKTAIAKCLDGPRPEACAHAAFLQCDRELGSGQDPDNLSACSAYGRGAWDERVDGALGRLLDVMQQTGRTKPSSRALVSSQRKWQSWSDSDCEVQTQSSEGAALHAMEINLCHSDHTAARARELEQLEKIWGR